jgi:hypothetical protein
MEVLFMREITKEEVEDMYKGLSNIAGVYYDDETKSIILRNGYNTPKKEVVLTLIKGFENYLIALTPEKEILNEYFEYLSIAHMSGHKNIREQQSTIWKELHTKYKNLPIGIEEHMSDFEASMHNDYIVYLDTII